MEQMQHEAFVERVLAQLPASVHSFQFKSWRHAGRPTAEGFGILPIAGADPVQFLDAVMDVDHYVGNVQHVSISRSVDDDRFSAPSAVRFYQKVNIPVLGSIHHELVLHRLGERNGYHVAAWHMLGPETDRLSKRDGFRSDYNLGAWLVAPGVVGYALASAPRRDDVGFLKFKALTKGADAGASRVVQANIEGMARWAARR